MFFYRNFLLYLFIFFLSGVTSAQNLNNGLIAHYPLDGNANDIGPNTIHGTSYNATDTTDCNGNPNSATYFDGINDFIALPNSPFLKPQLPVTFSFKIKLDANIAFSKIFATENSTGNYSGFWFNINNNKIDATFGDGNGISPPNRRSFTSSTTLAINTWYTITVIFNGPTNIQIYVDCQNNGGSYHGSGGPLAYSNVNGDLGRSWNRINTSYDYFKGSLDEVRIWDRALLPNEVSLLCDCSSLQNGLIAHYPLDGNSNDIGPNSLHGTNYNATPTTNCNGISNAATYFDGINDYIELPNSPLLKPQLPVTFSFRIKIDANITFSQVFATDNSFGPYTGFFFNIRNNQFNVSYGDGNGISPQNRRTITNNTTLVPNTWYTISVIFNGPTNIQVYVDCQNNGGTYHGTGGPLAYSNNHGDIGRVWNSHNTSYNYFQGTLDELRIWNRALTTQEIDQLCTCEELIVHYPLNGNPDDIGPHNLDGTSYNATPATDCNGTPNGATYFDGVNDYIALPNNPLLKPQLPISMSFNIKVEGPNSFLKILQTDNSTGNYQGVRINLDNNRVQVSYADGSGINSTSRRTKTGTTQLQANKWYSVSIIINGPTSIDIYVDCQNDGGSYTGTGAALSYSNGNGDIGRGYIPFTSSYSYFKGYLDEFKMWNKALSVSEISNLCDCNKLIAHYPLNGNANDVGPNNLDGTSYNASPAPDCAGNPNGATYFDGIDDYIALPIDPLLKPQLPVSFSFRLKIDSYPGFKFLFSNDNVFGHYYGIYMNIIQAGSLTGHLSASYGDGGLEDISNRRTAISNSKLNLNEWYQITVVMKGPMDMDVYIDCLKDAVTYEGSGSNLQYSSTSTDSYLGRYAIKNSPYVYFQGYLDEFKIWNDTLTLQEIEMLNQPCGSDSIYLFICDGDSATINNIDFYKNSGVYIDTLFNASWSGCDSVVTLTLDVDPVYTQTVSATICQGDTFFHGSNFYTLAGTYLENYTTVEGCDSTITVNLTVDPTFDQNIAASICDGDTFFLGTQHLTTTGIFTENMLTTEGCDSTVTVDLTVNPTYNSTITANICDGDTFFHGNNLYTTTGLFTETYSTVNSCDSIINIDLTVDPVYDQIVNSTICEGDTFFHGNNFYTLTGTYLENHTTVEGCDSTITVNLNVDPTFDQSINASICDGDTFFLGTQHLTTTGIFTENMLTTAGCDSTVTVDLTVNPTYNSTITANICDGDTFFHGNNHYTTTGLFIETYSTVNSCDSIISIDLTVDPVYDQIVSATICEGDTFFHGSNFYTLTGTYVENHTTVEGCDSTITVNLNVDPTFDQYITVSICDGDTFFLGTQYLTTTGIFTENMLTIDGCDSTVTVDLTVNPTYNSTITANICDGDTFFHGNNRYTTTGLFTETYSTVNSCDSIISIDLTVGPVYNQIVSATICEGDTFFHGSNFYTLTGTYVENHTTVEGCDSTITVNLNVDPTFDQNITASICDGDTFFLGTQHLTTTGIFTENMLTTAGCDSTVTVDLTVYPTYNINVDANICEGDTFYIGNNKYYSSGNYTINYSTSFNCDSILKLNLTIEPYIFDTLNIVLCEGDIFDFNGTNITEEGLYQDTLLISGSCPRIEVLNLKTIVPIEFSIIGDTVICEDKSAILSTSPSFQVKWSTNDSLYEIQVMDEGIYWAQLQTTCGIVDDSVNVHIEDCNTQIEVPNVFTPNGDGINDIFYVKADHINNYSINIYNRWNQSMFSSNTLEQAWDGRNNGKEVEAGIYFYIINYQDHSGKNKSLQGTITLIR